MSSAADYITTADAAKRARVSVSELLTTWSARHGVELAYDASGKVIGLRRDTFEAAVSNVDPLVRAWVVDTGKNSARQQREDERVRLGQRGHSSGDSGAAVRKRLGGDRPPTASNDDRSRIPKLVGEGQAKSKSKSTSKPSKGDLLLRLIGTQNKESSLKPKPSEPGSEGSKDVEHVRRWLKL